MPPKPPNDPSNYNRCFWSFAGQRCAYVARFFNGDPARGGLCWGHVGCNDPKRGAEVVSRSQHDVPIDFDYSTDHLVELSLIAYHEARSKPL